MIFSICSVVEYPIVSKFDLRRSIEFCRDVIGLQFAFEAPPRNVAFFWIGESGRSMLGLWSISTAPLGLTLHLAFDVLLDDLLGAHKTLKASGITTFSIRGKEPIEPRLDAGCCYLRFDITMSLTRVFSFSARSCKVCNSFMVVANAT